MGRYGWEDNWVGGIKKHRNGRFEGMAQWWVKVWLYWVVGHPRGDTQKSIHISSPQCAEQKTTALGTYTESFPLSPEHICLASSLNHNTGTSSPTYSQSFMMSVFKYAGALLTHISSVLLWNLASSWFRTNLSHQVFEKMVALAEGHRVSRERSCYTAIQSVVPPSLTYLICAVPCTNHWPSAGALEHLKCSCLGSGVL